MTWPRAWWVGLLIPLLAVAACEDEHIFVPGGGEPAPPRALDASYYAGSVTVSWELHPQWDGEAFRIYSRRLTDPDLFLIAEVTSCTDGFCTYTDVNVVPDVTYRYQVVAVDPGSGVESVSDVAVDVTVPRPTPPPVPSDMRAVALDGANYLRWSDDARAADDFSFYRIYLETVDGAFLLGETDSEGFLDELAENGVTSGYFVTSVDHWGHESQGSALAEGTPRPDFTGEVIYAFEDRPALAGFRFENDENVDPVVGGASASRHFRLEVDGAGWWLVPAAGVEVTPGGFVTTALKCGPGADAGCVDISRAPTSAAEYTTGDVALFPQTSYVLRYRTGDGQFRYGVIRVTLQGFDQAGDALMIFDWAHQTQAGNPDLSVVPGQGSTG